MSAVAFEYAYSYVRESTLDKSTTGFDLVLATSGGTTSTGLVPHPYFFDGFVEHAEVIASALLVVARVARTRFYTPPGMLAATLRAADPLVTSNGDRLRFESFSACCGVYCRLDVVPDGLDRPPRATGTTNVDFHSPMRDALAGVRGLDPMHLSVGTDELRVATLDGSAVERRVPLPTRWVRGLAEVQLTSASMRERASYPGIEVRRFLQALPRGSHTDALYAVGAGRRIRLATRPTTDAVSVAGVERLRVVEPVLRHARLVHTYGADPDGASGWAVELPGARLTLVLSPSVSRGFSGEGGVLFDLAAPDAAADADLVGALLTFEPSLELGRLAADADLPEARIRTALTHLAAAGRVGFDLVDGTHFHRELPYDPGAVRKQNPRLRAARALARAGHVIRDGELTRVRSGDAEHVVRHTVDGDRCTCTWFATHGLSRGPCKHILAARLAE